MYRKLQRVFWNVNQGINNIIITQEFKPKTYKVKEDWAPKDDWITPIF